MKLACFPLYLVADVYLIDAVGTEQIRDLVVHARESPSGLQRQQAWAVPRLAGHSV